MTTAPIRKYATFLKRHLFSNLSLIFIIAFVLCINIAAWATANLPKMEAPWHGIISGLSFSPYSADQDPDLVGSKPSDADLEKLLDTLAGNTRSIRTYSVLAELADVPKLAAVRGIDVTEGAWISKDRDRNEHEIASLIRLTHDNPNINRVLVGNESLLRTDVTPEELISLINRVKTQVNVPVSTAEPWHIWLAHPELVAAVDFITVHVLPYWEGIPIEGALPYLQYRYDELAKKYPGKHIVIGETGWPSDGQWVKGAAPSLANQARYIREFLRLAEQRQFDYFIVEAFDQPWKRRIEGTVGAYWGIWDQYRNLKFPMSGYVVERASWPLACTISILLALPAIIYFLHRRPNIRFFGQLLYAGLLQLTASMMVWTVLAALGQGVLSKLGLAWSALLVAQMVLILTLLTDGFEFVELLWTKKLERHFAPYKAAQTAEHAFYPKVSIHVPCYNEPPEMVMETLNYLAAMTWPNFEVLIIDNNTKDPAVWEPVKAYCEKLGPRFRFYHLNPWPGYKAGALNFALKETAPDAGIIGVIDSDYQVDPNWLDATIPFFQSDSVAFVQAPQDYRDWYNDRFKTMCHWEYAGFFHIGMVHRNERNAIIQHGTMTLIRKNRLEKVGGWAEWCICEDAELGLRLFEEGWEAVYLDHSFGKGLVPDSFAGYKSQRFRWAYGAIQILKRHWRALLPGGESLTSGQRFHFLAGWLPWLADAAHLVFASAAILWSGFLFMHWVEFPPAAFLFPSLSAFLFKIAASSCLYRIRVKCTLREQIGASVAGLSLTHTVGRAVWQGLFTSGKPFFRTPKCEDRPALVQSFLMAREEAILFLGLWIGAFANLIIYTTQNQEAILWTVMLLVQSIPYAAALITAYMNAKPITKQLISQTV